MPVLKPFDGQPLIPIYAWGAWTSGRYYFTPNYGSNQNISTSGIGTIRAGAFVVPNNVTLVRIGGEVTSGGDVGSKVRLGLYADDGTGRPGSLVIDAGTIAGDSATVQEITINQRLTAGVYWSCAVVQVVTTTQPTVKFNSASGLVPLDAGTVTPIANKTSASVTRTGQAGALPDPFGAAGLDPTSPPRIFVKVS